MMVDSVLDLQVVNSYAGLPGAFYTKIQPQPLTKPRLLHVNSAMAHEIGLSEQALRERDFLQVCAGTAPLPGGQTLAAVYSGHQFGVWAGQLGDGRAHLLGETVTPAGHWEWQLKGSGKTPYSRMGDGRAVLRSSVREYLASEAMAGLGIPTTRALALVVSDDPVYRETVETAAIVTRLSPSFVRFGTFEHFSSSPENLRILLRYVLKRFYPECCSQGSPEALCDADLALCLLDKLVQRTARLMADWMTVGFCHGVMNTDNMSVLGLTIDYGPYGFMDAFQADHVCNHTDTQGRYAWNAQPSVGHWNLIRLASSLRPLGVEVDDLKAVLDTYEAVFLHAYHYNMRRKFGLSQWEAGDQTLADNWWKLLHTNRADFTLSFRALVDALDYPERFVSRFSDVTAAQEWLDEYRTRVLQDDRSCAERKAGMRAVNPVYVLRNHLAQRAIDAAQTGDASVIDTLLMLLRDPYTEREGYEYYASAPPPSEASIQVSCSS